jgi:hypothetical protein
MLTLELNLCLLSILGKVYRLRLQNREANANASISSKPLLSSSIMAIISSVYGCLVTDLVTWNTKKLHTS